MTQTLSQVSHEHHERLLHHVNQMPEIADWLLTAEAGAIRPRLDEVTAFLLDTLLPHIDAAERTLYPELEPMFQNRHSMAPMRREHDEVRRLVTDLALLTGQVDATGLPIGKMLALRRVMYQLYAVLKIHLGEEDAYMRIVDQGVSVDAGEILAAALDHPGIAPA